MKGQILANLIVDHAFVKTMQNYIDLKPWDMYFDSSIHREGTDIGVLIVSTKRIPTRFKFRIWDHCSKIEVTQK